jgi:hypothetical protein
MTRDEAQKIVINAWELNPLTGGWNITAGGLLSAFEQLGMLKLDEPKSADVKFLDQVEGFGDLTRRDAATILSNIHAIGLKIIEK